MQGSTESPKVMGLRHCRMLWGTWGSPRRGCCGACGAPIPLGSVWDPGVPGLGARCGWGIRTPGPGGVLASPPPQPIPHGACEERNSGALGGNATVTSTSPQGSLWSDGLEGNAGNSGLRTEAAHGRAWPGALAGPAPVMVTSAGVLVCTAHVTATPLSSLVPGNQWSRYLQAQGGAGLRGH